MRKIGDWFQTIIFPVRELLARMMLAGTASVSTAVLAEISRSNIRRVGIIGLLAMPIHLVIFLLFLFMNPADPGETVWRQSIMISHLVFFVIMLVFTLLANRQAQRKDRTGQPVLHYSLAVFIMAGGLLIVVLDQAVGSSITVFNLVCLLCGALVLIQPLRAAIGFAASYLAFFFIYALAQPTPSLLLAGRVNALVGVGIGFALSVIMWRFTVNGIQQRQQIFAQQDLLKAKNQELEKAAFIDSLTTLPNRRFFDEIIKKEIALLRRGHRESSLIMLDLDHFKTINDHYGHPVGDDVLQQVAQLLAFSLRGSDLIARLGGEEFIILLPETPLVSASAVAEKLRIIIERHAFKIDQRKVNLTASFGVARLRLPQSSQFTYYSECDRSLYQAKQKGRNRVEVAVPAQESRKS